MEDDNDEQNDVNLPAVENCMTKLPFPDQEREKVSNPSELQDTSTPTSYLSKGDASCCLSTTEDDKDCKPSSLCNETELAGQGHSEGECGFPIGMKTSQCTKHSIHSCPVCTSSVFCNRTLFTSAASTQHIPQQTRTCMDTALSGQPVLLTGTFPSNMQELVLKVRVQNSKENDFIEIELNREKMTYQDLLRVSCCELGVNPEQVEKIRKLPNTLVRKDKDVARLQDFQELEFVLEESINSPFRSAATTLTELSCCYSTKAANLTY
ncbi:putative ANKRD40 C-terminal-like protein isoform X2 [Paroedura picta]|uniref:putative ANKRD40 C-terminal-like protein isoform X2 n=1 Tax=Paroedura picta TaxID=143630 RepID=UPI004055D641